MRACCRRNGARGASSSSSGRRQSFGFNGLSPAMRSCSDRESAACSPQHCRRSPRRRPPTAPACRRRAAPCAIPSACSSCKLSSPRPFRRVAPRVLLRQRFLALPARLRLPRRVRGVRRRLSVAAALTCAARRFGGGRFVRLSGWGGGRRSSASGCAACTRPADAMPRATAESQPANRFELESRCMGNVLLVGRCELKCAPLRFDPAIETSLQRLRVRLSNHAN